MVGLGEGLVRLSPPGVQTLGQSPSLDVHVGGAELNVLVALAAHGFRARWLTRLADNPWGQRIAGEARAAGVTPVVDWDPTARAAMYYVERGVFPRATRVHYDREHTAMTALAADGFDWAAELAGAHLAVTSGITSALGPGAAAAVTAFLAAAREAGVRTAFDVNHRATMWSWSECLRVVTPQLADVDVLFANRWDLLGLLDPTATSSATDTRDDSTLARTLLEHSKLEAVVMRANRYPYPEAVETTATVVTETEVVTKTAGPATVVDAIGAGDAAMAACLAALDAGEPTAAVAEATALAGALQHTVTGDFWMLGPETKVPIGGRRVQR